MVALTPARIAFLVAGLAAAAVGGALVFEHVFGYLPCMLCLWQRWPYYIGAPLALLAGFLALRHHEAGAKLLLVVTGLIFLGGAGLGIYHAGVEWSFWPGPTSCAGSNGAPTSAGGLMDQMRTVRIVPCDRAAWRFLGISLAGYNALIATALAGLAFLGVAKKA